MTKGPPGNCVYVGFPMVYQSFDKTVPHLLEPLHLTRCPRLKGHFFFVIYYSENPEFVPANTLPSIKPDVEVLEIPAPVLILLLSRAYRYASFGGS